MLYIDNIMLSARGVCGQLKWWPVLQKAPGKKACAWLQAQVSWRARVLQLCTLPYNCICRGAHALYESCQVMGFEVHLGEMACSWLQAWV